MASKMDQNGSPSVSFSEVNSVSSVTTGSNVTTSSSPEDCKFESPLALESTNNEEKQQQEHMTEKEAANYLKGKLKCD